MALKLKSTTNDLRKGWKLAWCHHFTHIACAKKLRGLRQKLDALRVQNGQSLSKYQGFGRKLICYKGISLFWTSLNSRLFVCSKCTIQSHISNFQPFPTSFVLFQAFTHIFELNDHENWQELQMISEKVESWHGIIISPTKHVQESREGYDKNWMHLVYKTDNLLQSIRISYGNSSVTKGFHFLNLFELLTFCVFKMHHSKPHHHFSILSDIICYFSCIY